MRKTSPSTISVPYSTTHRIMSPSTLNTANIYDNQCTSLFGDPVPPPADNFFEDLDKNLYGLRGRSSSTQSNSIVDDFPKANSFALNGERNGVPSNNWRTPTSRLIRNDSDDQPTERIFSTSRDRLASMSPTDSLQYPIANTLPRSRYLPQSAVGTRPHLLVSPPSVDSGQNDLWNVNIATRSRRLPSEFTDDIHLETVRNQIELENRTSRIFPNDPMRYQRRGSNESYSSGEWFKPNTDYEEWAKIPRLRPSSKNVMSINQQKGSHHGSPLASLIHGSNGSTSSDEKASPDTVKMRDYPDDGPVLIISKDIDEKSIEDDSPPKELPPPEAAVIPKEVPLPILTNAVTTGSNFRANPPRPHKKPSFSIVAERSPQSSRAASPSPGNSGRVSPFLGYGFKEPIRPKTRQKSIQPSKLPNIKDPNNNVNTSEDSVRPLVQFDMSSFAGQNGMKPKVPERTKKKKQGASTTSNQKNLPKVHSFESLPKIVKTSAPSLPSRGMNKSSLELSTNKSSLALPTKNPTSRQRGLLQIYNSAENSPSRIPVKANGVSSMEDISVRRRKSLSPARKELRTDSISSERRSSSMTIPRSSITSDRRSSNLSTVTTSDFSFRRHSVSPPRSVVDANVLNIRDARASPRSPRRVARPTSLSPIIGTPNKDAQLSTEEQFATASNVRRNSQSRIPYTGDYRSPSRSNSRVASRNNSRSASLVNSRGASPSRDFLPISRPNSRITSRPTSRSSSRADSRVPSRIPSRSNSRNSLNERYDVVKKKASSLSPPKSRKQSPHTSKSRSESPRKSPRRSLSPRSPTKSPSSSRARSLSRTERRSAPTAKSPSPSVRASSPMKSTSRGREKTSITKITRIPSRKDSSISAKKPINASKKPEINVKRSLSVGKGGQSKKDNTSIKNATSSLKRERSNLKATSSFRRETSSLRKDTNTARKDNSTLKREPSNLKREPSNLKRETSNLRKETSNLKREPSNLKREGSTLKREPSNLKKEAANSKKTGTTAKKDATTRMKEISTLKKSGSKTMKMEQVTLKRSTSNAKLQTGESKKEPSKINRENSNLMDEETSNSNAESLTIKREHSNIKREGSRLSLKKTSSNPIIESVAKAVLIKKRSEANFGKKLEKKSSFRKDKAAAATAAAEESDASTIPVDSLKEEAEGEDGKTDKLIPLTKANVVSMTTAAITAQPVQITTTITNQMPLTKSNSSGQLLGADGSTIIEMDPVSILEKSQKTLETVQKTVAEATEEIQKAIDENLHDLKVLESDMGRLSDDNAAPFEKSDSLTTILENPAGKPSINEPAAAPEATRLPADGGEAPSKPPAKSPAPPSQPIEANVSVLTSKKSSDNLLHPKNNTTNGSSTSSTTNGADAEDMAERVSERAISVLPEVECESANLQSFELHNEEDVPKNSSSLNNNNNEEPLARGTIEGMAKNSTEGDVGKEMKSNEGDAKKSNDSPEYLDEEKPKGCCSRFCSKLCIPCRRCQCCSCCGSKKSGSARSDERIIVEEVNEKRSCWGRCCRKKKVAAPSSEPHMEQRHMESIQEEPESEQSTAAKKQNGCYLCLGKVFCCRKTNKVETTSEDTEEVRKCCFCIPCGKKKKQANAWQERRESIISDPPQQPGCCSRLCTKIFCCCRKPKPVSESRRTSMNSKKQSIVPIEDNRPKLHNDLVEYNSKMKGAIPVLPMWIAWFCMICNCLVPGLGTIFSGFFCICVGIPRFSQYDSAKARIGSLIINCIVGVAQAFCVLFCFVGWGWSIWWGAIMLKMARKLKKIRRVEELEMQEEQRQQAAERARIESDLEAQKKDDKK